MLSRATPTQVSAPDAWKLFDRSVSSGYVPDGTPLTVTLASSQLLLAYKVNGPAPYRLTITTADGGDLGFVPLDLSRLPRGWQTVMSDDPVHVEQVKLVFTPTGAPRAVPELELWTDSEAAYPTKPDLTEEVPPAGYLAFKGPPGPDNISPGSCQEFPVELAIPPSELVHASLVYTATGVFRSFSLQRFVNGLAPAGGRWLSPDAAEHVVVDQIDPETLQGGTNTVKLCLPADATNRISISKLRVIGELDRGAQFANAVTIGQELRDGAAMLDGNASTVSSIAPGEPVVVEFERLVAPDALHIEAKDATTPKTVECLDRASHAIALRTHRIGADIEIEGDAASCAALRLTFAAAADISELRVVGSGAAERTDWPHMVITSAPEHFGDVAWVGGFTVRPQNASGGNHIVISGKASDALLGDFGDLVHRPSGNATGPWSVDVDATYADGSTETRTIVFDRDQSDALAKAKAGVPVGLSGNDSRFSVAGASVVVHTLPANRAEIRLGSSVGVDVPVGAVTKPTDVTVRHLPDATLPPLDPGMVNVTAPKGRGYEFLPHGQHFAKTVETIIPYDPSLIPASMGPDDVHTYFYDPTAKHWQKLDRTAIDVGAQVVHSATDHFTIMINAVLAVPSNPSPMMMDPTSLSSIAPASPAAGIALMEPPTANSMGDARTALPIRIPPGRGAFTPSLAFSYSSASENGWLGVGWDVNVPRVEIDTRWGVPTYADNEEVRYMLGGVEIVPTTETEGPKCADGSTGRRYHPRVEGGFEHILRCGTDPSNYWFEVRDPNGTLYVYGNYAQRSASASLLSTKPKAGTCSGACPPGIYRWYLNRVVDIHGNETDYTYAVDDITGSEPGRDVYLSNINYTLHSSGTPAANYNVDFIVDNGTFRHDKIISGRGGFKQVTRKLLHSVKVRSGTGIVRQYVLTYTYGQFDKTVLSSIKEYGTSGCSVSVTANSFAAVSCPGAVLDEHTLSYLIEPQGFDAPILWNVANEPVDVQGVPVLGKGYSNTTFGSLSVATPSDDGSSGELGAVGVNASTGSRNELVGLYDLNGDGLPDQAYAPKVPRAFAYSYNQNLYRRFSASAGPILDTVPDLGWENHSSWGVDARLGVQSDGFGATLQAGYANSTSRAKRLLLDVDGDGYIDEVDADQGNCKFSGPCTTTPTHQCFTPGPFGVLAMVDPGNDPLLGEASSNITERSIPGDPVVQWTAPFAGYVTITATVGLRTASADGVTAYVYQGDTQLKFGAVTTPSLPFTWTTPTKIKVAPGDHLYLLVANNTDGGVTKDGLHDMVNADMSVSYTETCDDPLCITTVRPRNNAAHEPTKRTLYDFSLASEQRLSATTPIAFPVNGHVHLHGFYKKIPGAADIKACIQVFEKDAPSTDLPCSTGLPAIENDTLLDTSSTQLLVDQEIDVTRGQRLVLRAESSYSFDPNDISFIADGSIPRLAYTKVCDPDDTGDTCTLITDPALFPPIPLDLTSLGFRIAPPGPPVVPGNNAITVPPFPFIVRDWKDYTVQKFQHPFIGTPIKIAARSDRFGTIQEIHCPANPTGGWCNLAPLETFAPIRSHIPGDSLTFEVVPDVPQNDTDSVPAATTTSITIQDSIGPTTAPLVFHLSHQKHVNTPFAGGYRGWRNAFWNERKLPFAPEEVLTDFKNASTLPSCGAHDNPCRRLEIARTAFAPIAAFNGTSQSVKPAWISQIGPAFINIQGEMNGGILGGGNAGGLLPEGGLFEGGYARLSTTKSYFVGASGLTPLAIDPALPSSAEVGVEDTKTGTDLVDMNGDGIVDVVAGYSTFAGRLSATPGPELTGLELNSSMGPLRKRHGYNYSLSGFGAMPDVSAGGRTLSMFVPPDRLQSGGIGYSNTTGLQMGRSEDTDDLIDINGDGLPDRVSRSGTSITVRYNLGNQFGAAEQFGTVAGAMTGAIDPFQSLEGASTLDSTSNALSHETTVTEDDTTTIDAVFWKITKNTHQTSARTSRQFLDINGDGLPDLLMKKGAGQDIVVQLNRGGDFSPTTTTWTTPSWGLTSIGPSFSTNFAALLVNGTHMIVDNDVLAGTSSQQSRTYSGELVLPLEVVNLHANLAFTDANDTYELALMDIDGDGVADHVLRRGDDAGQIRVKHNEVTGRANLLQTVHRPLGGSFTLSYTSIGNTQDMPHRRQVLSSVTVDDGQNLGSSFASPNIQAAFNYVGGYYNRNEKTFMGFSSVYTEYPDGQELLQYFENHSFALMGHLTRESVNGEDRDSNAFTFSDRVISTSVVKLTDATGDEIGPDPACVAALPGLLQRMGDDACRTWLPVVYEDDTTRTAEAWGPTKTRRIHVVNLQGGDPTKPLIDRFGNPLESTDEVDDAFTSDDTYTVVTYDNDVDNWLIRRPLSIVVREGTTGPIRRSRAGEYYTGTPDLHYIYVDTGATRTTTTLGYDPYGNLWHIETPPNKKPETQTYDLTFDTTTQTYPISTQNGFLDKSQATYDYRWGVPLTETDPNGGRITRAYDGFGRVTTVSTNYDPTGTVTLKFDYYPNETYPRAVTTATGSAISTYTGPRGPAITTATFVDGLGRTIETRKIGVVNGILGTTTSGVSAFDEKGRTILSYQPFFSSGASTSFMSPAVTPATNTDYDMFDHLANILYPDGAQESILNDIAPSSTGLQLFRAAHTDANNHHRETFTDAAGRTREFVEHPDATASVTRYDYQATGELATIYDAEPTPNVTSFEYDWRGLRLKMISPDAGTISQTFDDMGNRTSLTDAKQAANGKTVQYVYSRDRLASITYPTPSKIASFSYLKGRLRTVTDETGSRTFSYDLLGNVIDDNRKVKNSSGVNVTFDTKFTYDTLGRQLQIIYPEGTAVTNTYNEGGQLTSVAGAGSGWSRTYADQMQYDVFGNRIQIRYGNNVVTTMGYEQPRNRLSTVQTNLPSNDQIQNLLFHYDSGSNPTSITNTLPALTSSSGNHPGKSKLTLGYDNADQLLTATGSADFDPTTTTNYTETTSYSPSHNILTKSRVHQLVQGSSTTTPTATNFNSTYAYIPSHPHLPDTVGGHQITYDPNGNPTQRLDASGLNQTLVWDDDNRLIQVLGSFGTQNNIYDANGLRVRRDSGTQHTIFASQYFDLEGTNQSIKHIYAGGTRIASVLDANYVGVASPPPPTTSGTPYFFHDDHLGSTTVVTTDTGTVQESHEYFSDGELWIDRTPATPQNRYLFNGKPFDRDTGFYDFGQRFYDPRVGMWLGLDAAFLGTPETAIGRATVLAASGFVGGSPLAKVDPDGRDFYKVTEGTGVSKVELVREPNINDVGTGGGSHAPPLQLPYLRGREAGLREQAAGFYQLSQGRPCESFKCKVIDRTISITTDITPVVGTIKRFARGDIKGGIITGGIDLLTLGTDVVVEGALGPMLPSATDSAGHIVTDAVRGGAGDAAEGTEVRSGCFTAGTLVHAATGEVPIEAIEVGDLVWARNVDTGELDLKHVTRTFVRKGIATLDIDLAWSDGYSETIRTTAEHPFRTSRGWVAAGALVTGDAVESLFRGAANVVAVRETGARETVYNIEVGEYHTYYVGKLGTLVHNNPCDLPRLDGTGKVHGQLPDVKDLGQYTPEDLAALRDELKQSVRTRIEVTTQMGTDYGHAQRQAAEQRLIQAINKHLENQ